MAMIQGLGLQSAPAAGFSDPNSLHRGLARLAMIVQKQADVE